MATSSIHIEAGGNGYFAHNSRESKTVNAIFDDEQNYCSCTNAEAFETYKSELAKRTEAYKENFGRTKLHAKTITHLSAIVNFNKEHTPEDIKKVCDYLEKTFDTKVIQYAMHRDEGYINESGEKVKNYHAHIEFMGLDSKGNSVRRKLDKKALIELQSKTAQLLKMQRGKNYTELQEKRPKRLDTYEFKKAKEMEAEKVKDLLATKEQLKEANNQLRAFMKENGANRADYAELEKEKKLLEEKLKSKILTGKELLTKFQELEKNFKKEKEHLTSIIEVKEIDIIDLKNQNKSLEALKSDLTSKVITLQEKIVSSSNMSHPQPPKDIQEEFKKIKNEELEEKEVKTGLFSSEKIKVLKPDSNFFQRTWNLVASKYNELKSKYEDLLNKYNLVATENKALKKELKELRERSSLDKEKEYLNIVQSLKNEADRDNSSFLNLDKFKKLQNKEVETNEKEVKKRENERSR